MMTPMEPPTGPPDPPAEPPRPSSFEDWQSVVPSNEPAAARPIRRPPVLTTAAVVLLVAAVMNLLFVVGFRPSATVAVLSLAMGAAQGIGAFLVFVRHPVGYPIGIALGGLGVVVGITRAGDDALSALMTMALSGFVIWAVASNRPSFTRG
jgi:hypothetical protein